MATPKPDHQTCSSITNLASLLPATGPHSYHFIIVNSVIFIVNLSAVLIAAV